MNTSSFSVLNCESIQGESTAFSDYCVCEWTLGNTILAVCSEQSTAGARISARSLTFFQPLMFKEERQKRILFFIIYSLHLLPSGQCRCDHHVMTDDALRLRKQSCLANQENHALIWHYYCVISLGRLLLNE